MLVLTKACSHATCSDWGQGLWSGLKESGYCVLRAFAGLRKFICSSLWFVFRPGTLQKAGFANSDARRGQSGSEAGSVGTVGTWNSHGPRGPYPPRWPEKLEIWICVVKSPLSFKMLVMNSNQSVKQTEEFRRPPRQICRRGKDRGTNVGLCVVGWAWGPVGKRVCGFLF